MKHRLISSFFLVIVLFSWIFLASPWIFCSVVAVVIGFALWEFYSLAAEKKQLRPFTAIGIGSGVIWVLGQTWSLDREWGWSVDQGRYIVALMVCLIFMAAIVRQRKDNIVHNIAVTLFGFIYLAYFGSYVVHLRFLPHASMLIVLLFVVTKMNDVGAYVIGSRMGRLRLSPHISPRKTVEGAVAGLLTGVLCGLGLRYVLSESLSFVSYFQMMGMCLLLGLLGQLGDLFESMVKRDFAVKDTGRFIPGFGGALDVLDSLFWTSPALYFYVRFVVEI